MYSGGQFIISRRGGERVPLELGLDGGDDFPVFNTIVMEIV